MRGKPTETVKSEREEFTNTNPDTCQLESYRRSTAIVLASLFSYKLPPLPSVVMMAGAAVTPSSVLLLLFF